MAGNNGNSTYNGNTEGYKPGDHLRSLSDSLKGIYKDSDCNGLGEICVESTGTPITPNYEKSYGADIAIAGALIALAIGAAVAYKPIKRFFKNLCENRIGSN